MSTLTAINVTDLVSREATEAQSTAREHSAHAIEQVALLLDRPEVMGEHRKQLAHALELLRDAADFLGPVMVNADAA
jgi:hypothetical protein